MDLMPPIGSPARNAMIDQLIAGVGEHLDALVEAFCGVAVDNGTAQTTADCATSYEAGLSRRELASALAVAVSRLAQREPGTNGLDHPDTPTAEEAS